MRISTLKRNKSLIQLDLPTSAGHVAALPPEDRIRNNFTLVNRQCVAGPFVVMAYSGYLKDKDKDQLAPGLYIPKGTPPVFLVHGGSDLISPPEHSVLMYLALKRAGIPAELHVYADTAHDFAIRPGDRPFATWPQPCSHSLKQQGFLTTN